MGRKKMRDDEYEGSRGERSRKTRERGKGKRGKGRWRGSGEVFCMKSKGCNL